ncbi:ATP-dependent DNA helicase RecG [Litorivivens sp.]|uniref:ATP-dependent DNA helicase RecG n=1 Tax=Litorivivens sp. TaxID=2020868 RepID=UPI0035698BC0
MTDLQAIAIEQLKGVGPRLRERLNNYGVYSAQDLLFHLPLRYQDRTRITPIGGLQLGVDAVIEGEVKVADITFGKRRSLLCKLQDGTGLISLRFFHFSAAQKKQLQPGTRLRCYGEPRRGGAGLEIYHPEYQLLDEQHPAELDDRLTPVYPTTEGIGQSVWRKLCLQALTLLENHKPQELLSEHPLARFPLSDALHFLHHPPPKARLSLLREGLHPAQRRLAFEELLAHNLAMLKTRQQTQQRGAVPMPASVQLQRAFLQQLGFQLTNAQQRVCEEIAADLRLERPMLRLVQGDVGSGKTVVAAMAALQVIEQGFQVAVMAPTEILAEQHYLNFQQWFAPLGLETGWLVGKLKGKARQKSLATIANGEAQLVIGTHALFQEDVIYQRLGLAIIDEQHRFGVHQRLALTQKARPEDGHPHQLVMTATPIPRTLAMTAYADLDTSIIDELPPGRTPVNTVVIDNARRSQIIDRIAHVCAKGQQVYWVCTLIEESEALQAQAAEAVFENLQKALPNLQIALVHGRQKPQEKADIMAAFKAGTTQLLVATTVIEVGVDVPNASLMVIENAERLGLSQLHQLRGRVGRGALESHCVLLYQSPLSRTGRERLRALRESSDGFVIAEKDLMLRGPGEMLGTRQTGLMQFRIADLQRDGDLLEDVRQSAESVATDKRLSSALIDRWLGEKTNYAAV